VKTTFTLPAPKERNRTVARFTHNGENYTIHERTNWTSQIYKFTSRFICDAEGSHRGAASNVREARTVLNAKATATFSQIKP